MAHAFNTFLKTVLFQSLIRAQLSSAANGIVESCRVLIVTLSTECFEGEFDTIVLDGS